MRDSEADFRKRLTELGAELLEPTWLGHTKKHRVRCSQGHDCTPAPSSVLRGQGVCLTCAGKDPRVAEIAFRARLDELGAQMIGTYVTSKTKVHVRCAAGHDCYPTPNWLSKQGRGVCRVCAGNDPATAEAAFRQRLIELGAELLEPAWRGSGRKHHVRCRAGHDCYPMPSNVRRGQGLCRACAGQDTNVAAAAFRVRLDVLGAVLLEPDGWLGSTHKHHVRCSAGHDCYPTPGHLQQGGNLCRLCAGLAPDCGRRAPVAADAAFRVRLAELGAELLESTWLGAMRPHRVRCAAGHDCAPRPNDVQQGHGICLTCAGKDPADSEARFRHRLTELGAELLEPYTRSMAPHHVRCRNGHDCYPQPASVNAGQGVCFACGHSGEWDAFYVVTSADGVKFGVTSGRPRQRLRAHARQGYTEVVRLVTGLPGTVAPDTERAVKQALALAGERPVRGKEYFDLSCLALVLDVADSWLDTANARVIDNATATIWLQEALFVA